MFQQNSDDSQTDQQILYKNWIHLKILLWKNLVINQRNKKIFIAQIFSPLIICLLLLFLQFQSDLAFSQDIVDPDTQKAPNLYQCLYPEECITLGYSIIGQEQKEWINYTLQYVAEKNNLRPDIDVALIYKGTNDTKYLDYLSDNKNKTLIGATFCTTDNYTFANKTFSCNYDNSLQNNSLYVYNIVYNTTFEPKSGIGVGGTRSMPTDQLALATKLSIDNGIISFTKWKSLNPNKIFDVKVDSVLKQEYIAVDQQTYPVVPSRFFQNSDVVAQNGGLYFVIPIFMTFIMISNEIMKEKEQKLRQYINIMGVSHTIYWMHWTIQSFVWSFFIAFNIVVFGLLFQFNFFLDTPFMILLFMFFSTNFAMQIVCFFITTLCANTRVSNSVAYGFLLFAWVNIILLSNRELIQYFYSTTAATWVVILRKILTLYPPFNFAKAYNDIAQYSGSHFDTKSLTWVKGSGFTYQLFTQEQYQIVSKDLICDAPSTFQSCMYLWLDALFFLLLTWYFDNVIQHNRGNPSPVQFLFMKSYWCPKRKDKNFSHSLESPLLNRNNSARLDIKSNVQNEQNQVIENFKSNQQNHGIRILNISKTYIKSVFGIKSEKNDFDALRNVYLQADKGELLTILGHNGAGKTTLISIMTGILKPSTGEVYIGDSSVQQDMDIIRNLIGICPQFDVLWLELTALEHLEFFSKIKFPLKNYFIQDGIDKLREVGLEDVGKHQVSTYSGGMKRRLSMSIASLGTPKIIFLDEPTTGMDPKSRKQVWELIQKLKKDKTIILTTHAMEEADVLSDRIAIMVDGNLKCIGDQLHLKNNFGDGYLLTLIVQENQDSLCQTLCKQILPHSKLIDQSGGSLIFTIPIVNKQELSTFFKSIYFSQAFLNKLYFKVMEKQEVNMKIEAEQFRSIVLDWGLSNTTLEEVFMRVTNKKAFKKDQTNIDLIQ